MLNLECKASSIVSNIILQWHEKPPLPIRTLWIALDIGGHWYTSGCIQYWRGLDRNGGPPSGYAANWYYDANRWAPMTGVQPAPGEPVGFFVTAGNARNITDSSGSIVYERSNVVVVPFPTDAGATFTY